MPDAATTAWVTAVNTNGGSVTAGRQTLVDNLIVGLKADGVWAKLERLWLFAAENEPSALTDLVGDTLATKSGTPTFTVDTGYTGADSVSGAPFINTGYAPAGAGLYTQTDAHWSVWCMTNLNTAVFSSMRAITCAATALSNMYFTFTDGHVYYTINGPQTDAGLLSGIGTGTKIGHWLANRTGLSLDSLYQNGSSIIAGNLTATGTLGGNNFTILDGPSANAGNLNTFSVASMGASLTTGQITSFYNRLSTYLSFPATGATILMGQAML